MALMTALLAALFAAVPAQAQNVTYGGQAYAVGLTGVAVANITVADQLLGNTGALPPGGGSVTSGPGTVTLPAGLGSVTIVTEQANGVNETSTATSQIASVSILPGGVTGGASVLGATVLTANTGVNCAGLATLSSSLATLTIAGQTVPINPNPNTTTTVLATGGLTIATVTFNRQTYNSATNAAAADALVVDFPTTGTLASVIRGTITISHGNSDLTGCATTTPTPTPPPPAGSAPGFPRAGALADQAPLNSNVALLAVAVLLLVSASTGLLVWRRSI
jgi:hypothetical protein